MNISGGNETAGQRPRSEAMANLKTLKALD